MTAINSKHPDFYSHAKIYKIVSNETENVYYGSTCNVLSMRLSQHRKAYRFYLKHNKHYCSSYEVVKFDDVEIILIESFSCKTKEELHARERFYIEGNVCVNKQIPGRTKEEYPKEMIAAYNKEYRQINREQINAKKKEKFDCKCGNSYTKTNKLQHERSLHHRKYLANLRNDSDSDDLSNEIEQLNNLVIY